VTFPSIIDRVIVAPTPPHGVSIVTVGVFTYPAPGLSIDTALILPLVIETEIFAGIPKFLGVPFNTTTLLPAGVAPEVLS